jgi:hypothetical protein
MPITELKTEIYFCKHTQTNVFNLGYYFNHSGHFLNLQQWIYT